MIQKLIEKIQKTKAPICVGLDPMLNYIPEHILKKSFGEFGETLAFSVRGESAMNIGEAVKERIIELCRERDISINKLCNMSGVTQSTVNNIVSGRNNSATISTIKKLCDGLGITIQKFFASNLFSDLEQEIE